MSTFLPPVTAGPADRAWHWTLWAFCALVLGFLVLPILIIVPLSFSSGTFLTFPLPGLSLRWYQEFFTSAPWRLSLRNSLIVASATTLLATVLGTLAALGLTLAHTALATPFVVITVSATLQGFDANQARAGASLGASPTTVFRRIVLPLILPGVISGALFAFVTSFDEVVVALFLTGPAERTLPRQMFTGMREDISPVITAAASLLILLSVLLLTALELLRRRSERLRGIRA